METWKRRASQMPKERVVQPEGTADTKALRQEQEKASEEVAEHAQDGVCEARGARDRAETKQGQVTRT